MQRSMPNLRRHWPMAFALAAITFIGLANEAMRPGHHVHLASGGEHHHHFFVGPHAHEEPLPADDSGHCAADAEDPSEHGPRRPAESSSSELVDGFFLHAPSAIVTVAAPADLTPEAAPALAAVAPSLDTFLPGGSRAPPLIYPS